MKLSNLKEKVTLLEENDDTSKTTVEEFKETVDVRADITPLALDLFRITLLAPMRKTSTKTFAGIKWNNEVFRCETPFCPLEGNFLRGTIKKS